MILSAEYPVYFIYNNTVERRYDFPTGDIHTFLVNILVTSVFSKCIDLLTVIFYCKDTEGDSLLEHVPQRWL